MNKESKIYISGHTGLVGSAILRYLQKHKYTNIVISSRKELDLMNKEAVFSFFERMRPEYVVLAAARVGGIFDNKTYPVEFIRDNLAIQWNVIEACFKHQVKRLLFLGSSCIYPVDCPRPIKETDFLSGRLEPTNQAYAVAKIAGIEQCWSYNRQFGSRFLCAMPTNLYGPNDNYDLTKSHVLAALIRKIHVAKAQNLKSLLLWGSGEPNREFLHVDDLAVACCHILNLNDNETDKLLSRGDHPPIINVGSGEELSIKALAQMIKEIIGFKGLIQWDTTKPDGVKSKMMDVSLMRQLGWESCISLQEGIQKTYQSFLQAYSEEVSSLS